MHSPCSPVTVQDLEKLSRSSKSLGRRVVLCHGTFDLTHVGHIRHLQRARREGDILMVTVTGDDYVNRGPGRPVFSEELRAEALSALECVDHVAVHHGVSSTEVIESVRPNVYVKGSSPRQFSEDFTDTIEREARAVEAVGGTIIYTNELELSSSSLLNEHFGVLAPDTRQYLRRFASRHSTAEVIENIRALRNLRVCVVGDAIIDEYHYTSSLGQPGKGHGIAVQFESSEQFAGGAIAVANHVGSFCDSVTLVAGIGACDGREHFIRSHLQKGVTPQLFSSENSGTLVKRRYVDSELSKLFEVYLREGDDRDPSVDERASSWLDANLGEYDAVIVPDFGNGFISGSMVEVLCRRAPFLAVNTQLNSGNRGFHSINRYSRASFVSLNEPELRLAAHSRTDPVEKLAEAIGSQVGAQSIAITMGVNGLQFHDRRDREQVNVPALSMQVVDRIGAGDAFLSLASLCMAGGLRPEVTAFVGSAAAALDVQIVCNRDPVSPVKLFKYIATLLK